MPQGPFDVDLDLATRRDLGRRLRTLLEHGEHDVRSMALGLEVEPELIVIALREVRALPGGRLRSAIQLGRVTWKWEPLPGLADNPSPEDQSATEPVDQPLAPGESTPPGDEPPTRSGKARRAEESPAGRSGKKGKSKGKKG